MLVIRVRRSAWAVIVAGLMTSLWSNLASAQPRVRAGVGGNVSYLQAGIPLGSGQPSRVGFAPGTGVYFHLGAQISDRMGLYLHGTVSTALLAWTGGADLAVDWALSNRQITVGTGLGVRGVWTLFEASTYPPSGLTAGFAGPLISVLVGVPFTVAALFPIRAHPSARRSVRLGFETLTGVNVPLPNGSMSPGFQAAFTVGSEWD